VEFRERLEVLGGVTKYVHVHVPVRPFHGHAFDIQYMIFMFLDHVFVLPEMDA
jgi:hypothetical protein